MAIISPWRTAFAWRTYGAAILLVAAIGLATLTGHSDPIGWLAIRHDAAGVLYLLAAAVAGGNFLRGCWRAIRTARLDMNFLMTAAMIGAILIGDLFEAATLGVLFSFAELLERFAVDRGRRSIERLVELAPERADRLLPDGSIETVPTDVLRAGDRIRIRPGDKVPADGLVIAGTSAVNEATITGESLPRLKGVGDPVFAATLNTEGALDIEITADAQHSTLARIVELVRVAQARRAPSERFIQRFAVVYTPVVTAAAVALMLVPPLLFGADPLEWFVRGLTLLVIACPCALVIATPVTIVSALTQAARHGVLIKGGDIVESLGAMRAMALDKTGTLTSGVLRVERFELTEGTDRDELIARTAAVESRSEHPIARALVRFAANHQVAATRIVTEFEAVPGRGVRARVSGHPILIGAVTFGGPSPSASKTEPESGVGTVYVQTGDGLHGFFTVRDSVRAEARQVMDELKRLRVRPLVMLTGDGPEVAREVARAAGIDDVRSRLLPDDKVRIVTEMRAAHGTVGMLGDGINDAPALAAASVGIAMGAAGSPATIETADIALMADDLTMLPYAVALAQRTRRIIRANIAIALLLKGALAVGAVAGTVSLAAAVLLGDVGASLVVTINALRLARSQRPRAPGRQA